MKRLALILLLLVTPAYAVQPDEVLDDPLLELRAREISKNLRCLVCRNENIDESNADIARDLRLLVRERLLAGDSDTDVIDYIVYGIPGEFAGYGEYVLLRPATGGSNLLLWAAGPAMLIVALGVGGGYLRRRAKAPAQTEATLTEAEKERLAEILKD
ncbi:cytochrome c-type biogenesis protein CcmH [Cognatishimia sp. SS12]|uniref:cytochrome c-type biogenesis protein n=1 Tax=Cognatishimia sp. SS12 TaxID=2979465 RepID=UPI00232C8D83|nr:cytochrome c-type biogenesis protein [Cognatishimia sp. SS12]MDC0737451.1 cytochrome c-type biogenesis protein CcmH [Cognatishimia sp. SS12]